MRDVVEQVDDWMESPTLRHLKATILTRAKVAGICRNAGVAEIWTADRDYSRFPGILARNPLLAPT